MKQNFDNGSLIPKASLVSSNQADKGSSAILDDNSKKRIIKIAVVIFAVLAVSFFGIIAYQSLKYSNIPESLESVPLIKADLAPVKVVPKDPGGEQISNQDKLIYSTLENKNVKTKKLTEQLEVKEFKEVYSDAKTIRTPIVEKKPVKKTENKASTDDKLIKEKKLEKDNVKIEKDNLKKVVNDKVSKPEKSKEVKSQASNAAKNKADDKKVVKPNSIEKINPLELEKEIDKKPSSQKEKAEEKNTEISAKDEKTTKVKPETKISNPFDLVGDNE